MNNYTLRSHRQPTPNVTFKHLRRLVPKRPALDNLLVMKFGGTSMGGAERMRAAAEIISAHRGTRPVVVVVSAMSKVTDLLLETMRRAEVGDRLMVDQSIEGLLERHLDACGSLFDENGE